VKRVLETGRSIGLANHTVLIARDGTERIITDSGAPISTASGKIIGAVLVFRDVTLPIKIEREMRRAQRLESVGVLAGGIAHDFNNLLTVITANVSFAVRKIDRSEPEVAAILEDVLGACERAVSLTKQLLTFAKGGAPVRKPTSLGELVRTTVDFALHGSKSSAVYDVPPELEPVDVDPGQISQMITNLVINADEAMPAGGVIEVRCRNRRVEKGDLQGCAPGEYVELAIADHGVGVAPEVAARLFEPYFSTKQRGSGLGLATAYSIAKRHEGALSVDSRPGEGATFRVLLPAAQALPEAAPAAASAEQRRPEAVKGRVLVMDDESAVRAVEAVILTDLGYDVEAAADGARAIRAFVRAQQKGQPFDVVLLDLTVPAGMGGLETLQNLRQIDAELCAIATSGYAPDPVLADPRRYGFVASLPKPFRKDDLGTIVQRVLRQRSRQL
jgi:signal transduction histidine kinase/CheY-like chemotaxis protein